MSRGDLVVRHLLQLVLRNARHHQAVRGNVNVVIRHFHEFTVDPEKPANRQHGVRYVMIVVDQELADAAYTLVLVIVDRRTNDFAGTHHLVSRRVGCCGGRRGGGRCHRGRPVGIDGASRSRPHCRWRCGRWRMGRGRGRALRQRDAGDRKHRRQREHRWRDLHGNRPFETRGTEAGTSSLSRGCVHAAITFLRVCRNVTAISSPKCLPRCRALLVRTWVNPAYGDVDATGARIGPVQKASTQICE